MPGKYLKFITGDKSGGDKPHAECSENCCCAVKRYSRSKAPDASSVDAGRGAASAVWLKDVDLSRKEILTRGGRGVQGPLDML